MLDGFLVILIAVAIPAYMLKWFADKRRINANKMEEEENRSVTARWLSVLPASSEEITRAAKRAMYPGDESDPSEKFIPTPEKMAAYYFDTLGLAEDFRAIYGEDWRDKVRFIPDPNAVPDIKPRAPAVWRMEGFRDRESPEIMKAVTALLLSKEGKISGYYAPGSGLSITVVPNDRKPWANRWYKRIEQNLRDAGQDVTMYVCRKNYRWYKPGAFFAPDFYLAKLDEQEDDDG